MYATLRPTLAKVYYMFKSHLHTDVGAAKLVDVTDGPEGADGAANLVDGTDGPEAADGAANPVVLDRLRIRVFGAGC